MSRPHSRPAQRADGPLVELVRLAITARLAGQVGWPHLATAAARRLREVADRAVVELSPARARKPVEVEEGETGGLVVVDLGGLFLATYGSTIDEEEGLTEEAGHDGD